MFKRGFLDKPKDNKGKKGVSTENTSFDPAKQAVRVSEYKEKQKAKQNDSGSSSDRSKSEIPENFEKLGGNSELADAKVFFLGEGHVYEHHKQIYKFIDLIAKDGDIVLVEGVERNAEVVEKAEYMNSEASSRGGNAVPLSKDVKICGWDKVSELRDQRNILKKIDELENKKSQSKNEKVITTITDQIDNITTLFWSKNNIRNKILVKSMIETISEYADKRVFIIAGSGHFTEAPEVRKSLDTNYKYIALQPKHRVNKAALDIYNKSL